MREGWNDGLSDCHTIRLFGVSLHQLTLGGAYFQEGGGDDAGKHGLITDVQALEN